MLLHQKISSQLLLVITMSRSSPTLFSCVLTGVCLLFMFVSYSKGMRLLNHYDDDLNNVLGPYTGIFEIFFQILCKSRRYILVTFPSHLKKLRSKLRFCHEKLNCGFFHSIHSKKHRKNNFSWQTFSIDNNYFFFALLSCSASHFIWEFYRTCLSLKRQACFWIITI